MAHGEFLWADLSTFRPSVTQESYRAVMGWTFDADGVASIRGAPVAMLYEMPQKFQEIGMPSFWMSYIAVDDVAEAVEIARTHGGKVELGPAPFEGGGDYALIRDPLGAGFTVYQGSSLDGSATGDFARLGHGLFVSDASAVTAFYSALFGWSFLPQDAGTYKIERNGDFVAHLHEIPDPAVRGKEQYWAVLFACPDLGPVKSTVSEAGSEVIAAFDLPEGSTLAVRDPDGGIFFLTTPEKSRGLLSWMMGS